MKLLRPAFTLIEILVSVVILSTAIIYTLKIHSDRQEQIVYLTERNKYTLQDSLFLTQKATRYHKETKTAYEMLQEEFSIEKLKSRKVLQNISREFFIPEKIQIISIEETEPRAFVDEIKIRNTYSSAYFHFKINTLYTHKLRQ